MTPALVGSGGGACPAGVQVPGHAAAGTGRQGHVTESRNDVIAATVMAAPTPTLTRREVGTVWTVARP